MLRNGCKHRRGNRYFEVDNILKDKQNPFETNVEITCKCLTSEHNKVRFLM